MSDFKNILESIGDGVLYNLHTHTQWCDGRAPMADFARQASRLGFTHLGFSPHSPLPIPSTCNMTKDDVPLYFAEAERLQEEYPQMKILKGMEIDYIDGWGPAHPYFRTLPLDFSIGSVHFIPTQDGEFIDIDGRPDSFLIKLKDKFHGDLRYVVDTFFDKSRDMIQAGSFDIIGHYDKIKHNASVASPGIEREPWFIKRADDLTDLIIDSGMAVEINTKSFIQHHHTFPAQRHWLRLLKSGIPIVVNSDAHFPDRINASRPDIFKALRYLRDKR